MSDYFLERLCLAKLGIGVVGHKATGRSGVKNDVCFSNRSGVSDARCAYFEILKILRLVHTRLLILNVKQVKVETAAQIGLITQAVPDSIGWGRWPLRLPITRDQSRWRLRTLSTSEPECGRSQDDRSSAGY